MAGWLDPVKLNMRPDTGPGDLVITAPTVFVSINDMESFRNGLDSLLVLQNASGALPYSGSPFWEARLSYSFTYHLHSLLNIALYYDYTNDLDYLQSVWTNFTLGLEFSISHVDDTGLLNVTTSADWLREGMGGHVSERNSDTCPYPAPKSPPNQRPRTSRPTPSSTIP